MKLIPQVREIASNAEAGGKKKQAEAVRDVIANFLKRPEHAWFEAK